MKISDRDLKLLVIVLLAIVIACPIFFVIRPYNNRIAEVEAHITTLKERQAFLAKLNENRQFYNDSIVLLTDERNKIVQDFAEGLRDENTVMFLANTERQIPIAMRMISFSEEEPTHISDSYVADNGETVEGLDALTSVSDVTFTADYSALKDFLKFILDSDKRIVITSLNMDQNEDNGTIEGEFYLNHYAITGEGRELEAAKIPSIDHGLERIFGEPNGDGYQEYIEAREGTTITVPDETDPNAVN